MSAFMVLTAVSFQSTPPREGRPLQMTYNGL